MAGIGIVKIFFQPGVDIRTATAQVTGGRPIRASAPCRRAPRRRSSSITTPRPCRCCSWRCRRRRCRSSRLRTWRRTSCAPVWRRCPAPPSRRPMAARFAQCADRPRSPRHAGASGFRHRCAERHRQPEPDHSRRQRQDRHLSICDQAQRRRPVHRGPQRSAGQARRTAPPSLCATWRMCATAARPRATSCMSMAAARCFSAS